MTPRNETLLGHLAAKLAAHPENVAVDALAYVLSGPAARAAMQTVLRGSCEDLAEVAGWYAQQAAGEARPDLVGRDSEGRPVAYVEAKFWAGLTEHQPVTYLEKLPDEAPSVLLFVCPESRVDPLWRELLARIKQSGHRDGDQEPSATGGVRPCLRLGGKVLSIISWQALLGELSTSLDDAGQTQDASDIEQLKGLCDQMGDEAYTPISQDDIGSGIPKMILRLNGLVDGLVERLVNERVVTIGRRRAAATSSSYGRYLLLGNSEAWIGVSFEYWAERDTPLWLELAGEGWDKGAWALRSKLARMDPKEVIERGVLSLAVPLRLPDRADRETVLLELGSQVAHVRALTETGPS